MDANTAGRAQEQDAAAAGDSEKDRRARLEKFAQAHLDRAQTVSSGATRTALAWTVALVLIWFQFLEHSLTLVRSEQSSHSGYISAIRSGPEIGSVRLPLEVKKTGAAWKTAESAADDIPLELPFSIKLAIHPWWLPTFWLFLACALTQYAGDARKRVFQLTARGVRLQEEAGVVDPRIRSLVGGGIWWLAPIPPGKPCEPDIFRHAFGWRNPPRNTFAVACIAIALLLLQGRVQFLSLTIVAGLLARNSPFPVWFGILLLNVSLGVLMMLLIWRWFSASRPLEAVAAPAPRDPKMTRRRAVQIAFAGLIFNFGAVYAFAASRFRTARSAHALRIRMRRHHRAKLKSRLKGTPTLSLAEGLWENPRTGTVHVSARGVSCAPSWLLPHLQPINSSNVLWNERRLTFRMNGNFSRAQSGEPAADTAASKEPPTGAAVTASRQPAASAYLFPAHPHLARRTFMIERQAIAMLLAGDHHAAIDFLLHASNAASVFGLRTGMRLYDLLAGLAVRYGRNDALAELTKVLRAESADVNKFQSRLIPARIMQPWGSRAVRYLLVAAGVERNTELAPARNASKQGASRHHENWTKRSPRPSKAPRKNLDHTAYITKCIGERLAKWQSVNGKWRKVWTQQSPVTWSGIELPAIHPDAVR
jgi:hypothetical protein